MRPQIPKRIRKEVWEHHIGKQYTGKCSVIWCNNRLEALDSWHIGHNKPWIDGGENEIKNLYPLCSQCNLSMGTKTIDEFNKEIKKNPKRHWCICFCLKSN